MISDIKITIRVRSQAREETRRADEDFHAENQMKKRKARTFPEKRIYSFQRIRNI
jgi:hypothetical protein